MKLKVVSLVLVAIALPAMSETVTTVDGRTLELREDGTYSFIETEKMDSAQFVEPLDHYFVHHEGEYGQKRVRFMPKFKNTSDDRIIGVKFTARFLNAFGEEVFKFSGETDEPISPGQITKNQLFYYFEDNQFMGGEPYDKLLSLVTNNSKNIEVSFDMIAFEGGQVVKLAK